MEIGDAVLVQGKDGWKETLRLGEIIGETKTSWRVKYKVRGKDIEELYTKGRLKKRGAGDWSLDCIKEYDEEEWESYVAKRKKEVLVYKLKNFEWDKLNCVDLDLIYKNAQDCEDRNV